MFRASTVCLAIVGLFLNTISQAQVSDAVGEGLSPGAGETADTNPPFTQDLQDYFDDIQLSDDVLSTEDFKSEIERDGEIHQLAEGDSDGDGLSDDEEIALGSNPFRVDSDCDGILDADEIMVVNGVKTTKDSDNDGIIDSMESIKTDSDNDGSSDTYDPDTAFQVVCGKFDPFVITESETTTFTATAVTPNISRLVINPGLDDLELYDDGTHGDAQAGDQIFTLAGIGLTDLGSSGFGRLAIVNLGIQKEEEFVVVSTGNLFNKALWIWLVEDEDLVTDIVQIEELFVTRYGATIVDPKLAALVWGGEIRDAAKRFVDLLGNDFDFIEILPDGAGAPTAAAFYFSLVNEVSGIGRPIFDDRAYWGLGSSISRLLGIQWQNLGGPSLSGATTHEIMHQWQAFAGASLGFGQCVWAHWGVLGQGRGVMGGYDPATLVEISPGVFEVDRFSTCCGVGQKYTPLELYFAGLIPPTEVLPIQVPRNVNCASLRCEYSKCTFEAESLDTVTIDELISVEGPRVPGFGESSTEFKIAHVLVTDNPPTQAELSFINMKGRYIDNPENDVSFSQVSGGRGSTDSTILAPQINHSLNDAWYNENTDGQGFFITVFQDLGLVSLAWFTYDTELPGEDMTANLGDPGHRWLTAIGQLEGNRAVLDIELTSGGIFDTFTEIQRTDPIGSDGTITLIFDGCNSGTIEYDIPPINLKGIVPIKRVANDNIAACEALLEQSLVQISNIEQPTHRIDADISENLAAFEINSGLNDAWFDENTDGQGFFITTFSDLGAVSLAWFTYDTVLPTEGATANLGYAGHRWLTAVGPIEGNQATLEIEMTSGGLFDSSTPVERTDPPGADGNIILTFTGCNSATVEYDIPSINRQGTIQIQRVANDNIGICEALSTD